MRRAIVVIVFALVALVLGPVAVFARGSAEKSTSQPSTQQATQPSPSSSAQAPIKIGIIAPTTGNFAANGLTMINGWKLWWDSVNNTAAGRKIQMFYEDDAGNPDTSLTKARLLVEQQGVNMLVGALTANAGLADAAYMKTQTIPYFIPIVSADDLTQRDRIPNVIRIAGWTSSQPGQPCGEYFYQQGYRKLLTVGQDFSFGWESVGGFVHTFSNAGGTVLKQIWHPIGVSDFSPYIAQIQQAQPDIVFIEESGGDAVKFIQAWSQFGLKGKIELVTNETALDQSVLNAIGPPALGLESCAHYAEGRQNPVTQDFVSKYYDQYHAFPSYYAADMYTAAQILDEAIKAVNGDVTNVPAFIKAVDAVNLSETPMGPEKMDAYGNPILNIYLRKVVEGPHNLLWNEVVKTWPNVSQFWTFSPEQFLKEPVYSRSYQGIKGQ